MTEGCPPAFPDVGTQGPGDPPPSEARSPSTVAARRALSLSRARARLEASFDPDVAMVRQDGVGPPRHITAASMDYARCRLRDPDPAAWPTAARVVERVLTAQELTSGHPHRGGFRVGLEDAEVTGHNVVSFVLQRLAAIWHESRARLPDRLWVEIGARARLGLEELERLGVRPRYTNAALMDAANAILWGEILGDAARAAVGRAKLEAWVALTGAGAPHEYNSPGYLATDLTVLASLATFAADPEARLIALLMEERLWLHGLLRYHRPTGRQAGPHSRAYHAQMHGLPQGFAGLLWQELGLPVGQSPYLAAGEPGDAWSALTDFHCPAHLAALVEAQRQRWPYEVRESSTAGDLATYLTADYALGTASRTYSIGQRGYSIEHQANHCILHYRHPVGGWRALYTRFVVNDRYLGAIEQRAIRSAQTNLYDQGTFAGHQQRNVALALYGLELGDLPLGSVEALAVVPGPPRPDALYVDGRPVALPSAVPEDAWVIVRDGALWIGLRPLRRDHMGAPLGLELRPLPSGQVILAMPLFRSREEKVFWEYESEEAAFYRRNVRSGLAVVVGEAERYRDAETFAAHLAAARLTDELSAEGVRTVEYRGADAWLAIDHDLVRNRTLARRVDGQPFEPPALASPWAAAARNGRAVVAGATLERAGAAILFGLAHDGWRLWEATSLAREAGPLRLATPIGTVECEDIGFGSVLIEAAPGASAPTVRVRAHPGAPVRLDGAPIPS
jgi:hypothetical protein